MNVKNGFSTLNRLLGKKNKSQTISKSTSNVSIKSQFDTSAPLSSHLEQNTIPPVPIATANAPFEQTFRIIVLLPKDQFYVARLGAKTSLGRLLVLVCENKQLDPEKYEFRHPADSSQVFSSEQTIGAVGLSEIRLCHKSEAYDNFNADEIIKLRHTVGRDSLSSSELSSRNSKHTLKTASPYSSTNSLNSSDSAGMSINYRGPSIQQPASNVYQQKPPVAPTRKKRIAPRPPSRNSAILNGAISENVSEFKQPLTRKEFHASSPNLSQCSELSALRTAEFHKSNVSVDCNGNTRNSQDNNNSASDRTPGHLHCNGTNTAKAGLALRPTLSANSRPVSMSVLNSEIYYDEKELNGNREFNINGSAMDLAQGKKMPEPAPRKRIITAKKKAPAPPPRGLQPVASPRVTVITEVTSIEEKSAENVPNENAVKDIPTLQNLAEERIQNDNKKQSFSPPPTPVIAEGKVIDNGHTVEKSTIIKLISESQETRPKDREVSGTLTNGYTENKSELLPTIQASSPDLIIRSDEPSPPLTPPPLIKLKLESKLSLETTSSDDDDQVKVYNLKLGKTIVQPLAAYENSIEKDSENLHSPKALSIRTETASPVSPISPASPRRSDSPEWSYTIPAPPKFADNDTVVATYQSTSNCVSPTSGSILSDRDEILTTNDIFITSDIEDGYHGSDGKLDSKLIKQLNSLENENSTKCVDKKEDVAMPIEVQSNFHLKRCSSPSTPLEMTEKAAEVITELNNVINENGGVERIVRRANSKEDEQIESAKPCALSNFKIQSYITKTQDTLPKDRSPDIISDEDNLYIKSLKRPSLTISNSVAVQMIRSRASITRSDSFHSTRYQNKEETSVLNTPRSSSYVSLVTAQQTNLNDKFIDTNRRKSSSELSIGESPGLQSLIIMKSILNLKKDSNGISNLETDLKSPDIVDNASAPINQVTEICNSPLIETMQTVYRRPSFKDFVSISTGSTIQETKAEDSKESPQFETKLNHTECRNSSLIETKISELENSINNSKSIESKTTYDCDSSKENSPKNKIIISQPKTSPKPIAQKSPTTSEPERIYKYQGPPSINLSTWHDRPKVQVAIKTDKDYKFGLATPRASIENNSTQVTALVNSTEQVKSPEQDTFKIPFVRSVEYKKSNSIIQEQQPQSIERKFSDGGNQIARNNHPRPVSVNNQFILGRSAPKINRTSFGPVVKGFTSIEPILAEGTSDDSTQRPSTVIRSKSAVSTNILRLSTGGNNIQKVPVPFNKDPSSPPIQTSFFSQTVLRKTGLKEKILATNENVDAGVPKPHTQRAIDQQNCAKLELKLTTTVTSNLNSNFRHSIATDIPPPPPPVIRSVVTKQNSLGKSACIPDTRDQLLSAIRNFSKTSLKPN